MSGRLPRLVVLLLLVALAVPGAAAAPGPGSRPKLSKLPPGPVQTSDRPKTKPVNQRWLVRMQDPPLAQAGGVPGFGELGKRSSRGKLELDSAVAKRYRQRLDQQQSALFTTLQRAFPTAQVHRRYGVLFNGLSVLIPGGGDAAARLKALPGVAAVYPDQRYEPQLYGGVPQIGADKLWNSPAIGGAAKAGEGVKIAIIDAGIAINNPFFNPAGFAYPAGFPKGDPAHTTPKVIAARAYFRPDLPPLPGEETPQPGPTGSSHGTHVAGIAAGVFNTTATVNGVVQPISGVAPRAYLMNYKVFYENESVFSGSTFSTEVIAAIEDAVADGADVINMSLGGRADVDPAFDPYLPAAEAAIDAGVTVVFSAGNAGPDPSTAGSPGFLERAISVGATTTARTILSGFLDVTAPEGAPETLKQRPYAPAAFGAPIQGEIFGPAPYMPVAALGGSSLACEPLPAGSLAGRIALIERGVCEFSVKVFNAQVAGAIGAIVYNNEAGGENLILMGAGARADEVTIPAIFVQRSTGVALIEWYGRTGAAARVQIDPRGRLVEQTPDVLAAFSSRGPTFQGSLKPDVLAPGVNILSAGFGEGEEGAQHLGFGLVSGTSMAAPHVAGGAALLKQAHPNWSPADIKSALMSTAETEIWLDEERSARAGVLERGAGRIALDRAAGAILLFDRPSLSFGSFATGFGRSATAELAVSARNTTNQPQTYSLSSRVTGAGDFSLRVSPASLTVAPGGTGRFTVAIELWPLTQAGDYEGLVELKGADTLRLPVWARALPPEPGPKVLLIDNDGSTSLDLRDYAGFYGNALGKLGIPVTYLDVDALAGRPQTLPALGELQKHEIIIWFTGDNAFPSGSFPVPTPLTETDQNLLIAYLQGGGNLIASGQDLSFASDINPDPEPRYNRSDLYHAYLGPRFVQDDVYTRTKTLERQAVGMTTQPWLGNVVLDLSAPGGAAPDLSERTGAGNQASVDEITLSDADPRVPDPLTTPIFRAVSTGAALGGVIAVNRSSEPMLEQAGRAIPYRSTYLAFGLEGVRDDTGTTARHELLQAVLYWTVARPVVNVSGPVTVSGPNQLASFTATAESNVPSAFVRYRWDFGDGSPIVTTDQATVVHQYAKAGTYQARVEVTDSWGHKAVAGGPPPPPRPVEAGPTNPTGATGGAAKK